MTTQLQHIAIVFRVNRDEIRGSLQADTTAQVSGFVESADDVDSDATPIAGQPEVDFVLEELPPPVPPKTASTGKVPKPPPMPLRTTSTHASTPISRNVNRAAGSESIDSSLKSNQKKVRLHTPPPAVSTIYRPKESHSSSDSLSAKAAKSTAPQPEKHLEKKGGFRSAFRKGPGQLSNLLHKEEGGSLAIVPWSRKAVGTSRLRDHDS